MRAGSVVLFVVALAVVVVLLLRPQRAPESSPVRVRMGPYGAAFTYPSETSEGGRCCG